MASGLSDGWMGRVPRPSAKSAPSAIKKPRHLPVARGASKDRQISGGGHTSPIAPVHHQRPPTLNSSVIALKNIAYLKKDWIDFVSFGRERGWVPRSSASIRQIRDKKTAVKKLTAVNSEFSNKYNPSANPHSGTPPTTDGFRHTGSQHPIGRRISQNVIVHSHNKLP